MARVKRSRQAEEHKPVSKFLSLGGDVSKARKSTITHFEQDETRTEEGDGTFASPFTLPLASVPNKSDCYHCIEPTCQCKFISETLKNIYDELAIKRQTEICGARALCAKSLLPEFVSRMIRLMNISSEDTFYDFGCGNGSILLQVAYLTGAKCVGIEISEHNAKVAREACTKFNDMMEKDGVKPPSIEIIAADLTKIISQEDFFSKTGGKTVILMSNLLFPNSLTQYISERMRAAAPGTRILCFNDLYPHSRSVAKARDPEAFELFSMKDYEWQELSVEWCPMKGPFYIHTRKNNDKPES
ncbi:histone-lysine N-methyltransferase [Angomonas deanei]|uniref:Histone-lysine N-methyltransferase, H3 lysine-79 specific n=1 Tax=Angomonas deanei TaxID=59799 RepID=S9VDU3_9TRYP|nr:histone-lysine N-methyltransferase [Angomonas deanei]EPY39119.1 histone-lysine N-methyltransferase [Angomonas deanei]CAD2222179.1 Histone methylation protein DOT1/Mycolic acid cyclopropane synthetase/Methyltransferase domain containing protein, putative [Angomonas deanei]|eukprot:EPY26364.1 histone-lysine N-methyltransferase [Angomonas deanei]